MSVVDPDSWRRTPQRLCPAARATPDPCDCGYVGAWAMRMWKDHLPCPPTTAYRDPDGAVQVERPCQDCRNGGPGHLRYAGWEERCPRCGDIERFTHDGTLVEQRRNHAFDGPRDHTQTDIFALLDLDHDPHQEGPR